MIPVQPVPEPHDFEEKAGAPGRQWLVAHPDAGRPKGYWTPFKGALAQGFENRCAYCAHWINSSKGKTPADKLLDPCTIQDGWFEIHLPSLHPQVSNRVPDAFRERAAYALERLHLRDDERVLRQRQAWYQMFQDGEISLEGLQKMAPLIAVAVTRAGRS